MKIEDMEQTPSSASALPRDAHPAAEVADLIEMLERDELGGTRIGKVPVPVVDLTGQNVLSERWDEPRFVEAIESAYTALDAKQIQLLGKDAQRIGNVAYDDEQQAFPIALYAREDGRLGLFDTTMPEQGGVRVRGDYLDLEPVKPDVEREESTEVEVSGKGPAKGRDSSRPPPRR